MSQSMGRSGQTTGRGTADTLKYRYEWLQSFTDDELSQISYCSSQETMRAEEDYFDISNPENGPIQGIEGQAIPEGSCYVPRSEVRRDLWDKLVGYRG